eukprot:gene23762-biopygen20845
MVPCVRPCVTLSWGGGGGAPAVLNTGFLVLVHSSYGPPVSSYGPRDPWGAHGPRQRPPRHPPVPLRCTARPHAPVAARPSRGAALGEVVGWWEGLWGACKWRARGMSGAEVVQMSFGGRSEVVQMSFRGRADVVQRSFRCRSEVVQRSRSFGGRGWALGAQKTGIGARWHSIGVGYGTRAAPPGSRHFRDFGGFLRLVDPPGSTPPGA